MVIWRHVATGPSPGDLCEALPGQVDDHERTEQVDTLESVQ